LIAEEEEEEEEEEEVSFQVHPSFWAKLINSSQIRSFLIRKSSKSMLYKSGKAHNQVFYIILIYSDQEVQVIHSISK
jgi:hypothetical protein